MEAHFHIKSVEVFNSASKLLETVDLPRLVSLIENLQDLLNEQKSGLDLSKSIELVS